MGFPAGWMKGFAQYVSKGAHASYQRARGYIPSRTRRRSRCRELIPFAALVATDAAAFRSRGNFL